MDKIDFLQMPLFLFPSINIFKRLLIHDSMIIIDRDIEFDYRPNFILSLSLSLSETDNSGSYISLTQLLTGIKFLCLTLISLSHKSSRAHHITVATFWSFLDSRQF